jgi:hypothetical protein
MEKKWLVYLGEQMLTIVYAPIAWTVRQVKKWLLETGEYDWSIDLRLPS